MDGQAVMKKFEFVSQAAMKAYLALPKDIQYQFGNDLYAVQQGKAPFSPHKVLTESVGPGAIELIENGSPAYRAVYCVKYLDTVFVLHAFEKTTNGVDRKEMATAEKRYKEMKARVDAERKLAKASTSKDRK
jgi:phage-related protein